MKIYASRQDKLDLSTYAGTDMWIRALNYNTSSNVYINVTRYDESNDIMYYKAIPSGEIGWCVIKGPMSFISAYLRMSKQYKIVHPWLTFKINKPIDIMLTDEILSIIAEPRDIAEIKEDACL